MNFVRKMVLILVSGGLFGSAFSNDCELMLSESKHPHAPANLCQFYTIYSMLVHTANGSTGAEGTCSETKLQSIPANLQ